MTADASAAAASDVRGVHYRTHGSGEVGVVVLHPAFADARVFDDLVAALQDRYRVVAIDLPGHGASAAVPAGADGPSLGDLPPILAEILDHEGLDAVHLVGASLGGLVAQDVAQRRPERVRSLTAVGSYRIDDPIPARAQRFEMLRWLPMVLFAMGRFRRYVARVSTATEHGRERFLAAAQGFTRAGFRAMRGLPSPSQASPPPACPVWIVVGEHDLPVVHAASRRWHEADPATRLTIVPGAGHVVPLDAPTVFAEALIDWLAHVDRPRLDAERPAAGTS